MIVTARSWDQRRVQRKSWVFIEWEKAGFCSNGSFLSQNSGWRKNTLYKWCAGPTSQKECLPDEHLDYSSRATGTSPKPKQSWMEGKRWPTGFHMDHVASCQGCVWSRRKMGVHKTLLVMQEQKGWLEVLTFMQVLMTMIVVRMSNDLVALIWSMKYHILFYRIYVRVCSIVKLLPCIILLLCTKTFVV